MLYIYTHTIMEWYWYSWFVKYIFGVFWLLISLVSGEDTPVHISTLPPPTSWDLQFVAANVGTSHRLRIMISNSKYLLTTTYHCSKISKVGGQQFAELDRIIKNPPISGFRGNAAGYFFGTSGFLSYCIIISGLLVGAFKHVVFSHWYMGCHPSHWLICFKMVKTTNQTHLDDYGSNGSTGVHLQVFENPV